ncbi:CTBL1 protein, partial [Polypterus senegalus]
MEQKNFRAVLGSRGIGGSRFGMAPYRERGIGSVKVGRACWWTSPLAADIPSGPDRGAKRPRDEDVEDEPRGRHRLPGVRDLSRHVDRTEQNKDDSGGDKKAFEKLMDNDEEREGEPLDESSIKKMILTFEKRSYKNQELRIKFPDNPEKFMESELDLNDIIQEIHVIATMPDLYHLLVELNAVHSLLGLLSHENTDILFVV